MASQSNLIAGSGYGNIYIDALAWGCGWVGSPITYYFGSGAVAAEDSAIGGFFGAAWSDREKAAFETALGQYSAVCNLSFQESANQTDADIVWWLAPSAAIGSGTLGMHEVPDGSYPQIYGYMNHQHSTWGDLRVGSYGYITIIHELGHGLGLAHPHDGGSEPDATKFPGVRGSSSTGSFGLNQGIWTTMSYNDGWSVAKSPSAAYGWQGTPMAFDVAALQAMYGANTSTQIGDDTYLLPAANGSGTYWSCIWDAGGTDTLSNAGSAVACTINLNAAPLTGSSAGGFVSRASGIIGGFTIANGVVIENAVGGNGNDTLVGNAAANHLDGGFGADAMSGGLGDDVYWVDNSSDRIFELAGQGLDWVHATASFVLPNHVENLLLSGSGAINATGNGLNNLLVGNAAKNTLNGGAGDDVLIGGTGADRLTGGRGNDLFRFEDGDTGVGLGLRDEITDFRLGDLLDLSAMDADTGTSGDQPFVYVGAAAFSGVAGELRFTSGVLAADVDGDAVADFEIALTGVRSLAAASLIL